MNALHIFYPKFDEDFFKLPTALRARIEARIDLLGLQMEQHPHQRLQGMPCYKLRVGDYRVIYGFDLPTRTLHLYGVGHRREVYRR